MADVAPRDIASNPSATAHPAPASPERLTLNDPSFRPSVQEEHLARYRFAQRFVAGKNVLDFACGTGYGSDLLARPGAARVLGVDLSVDTIEANRRLYAATPNLEFRAGDAQALPELAEASFDLVVSFETLEHLPDVDRYLAEVHRVLRPGGTFIVSTPEQTLFHTAYPWRRGRSCSPFHVREYTRRELDAMLRKRFTIQEWLGQNFVRSWLAPWPVQGSLKAVSGVLAKTGITSRIPSIYHWDDDFDVQPVAARPGRIPRFWVVICQKR